MANATDTLKKIASALRPKRGKGPIKDRTSTPFSLHSLEELVSITSRQSLDLEERIPRNEVLMKRNEVLYRLDPLVWAGINKLTRLVASPSVYFSGKDEDDVVTMEMFIDRVRLRTILPFLIKDIFLYGYGVAEIVKKEGKIEGLAQIDPKTFDYIRIAEHDYVERNPDGSIKGFVQDITGQDKKYFKPEDVLIVKFYTLGELCLGMTPLEAVYKASWIKLNLEEALGEAVYRHGYPVYWYKIGSPEAEAKGFEITPDKVKEAREYLKQLSTANELILPYWIEPGRLDAKSQIGDISSFLQYLSAEIMAGLEVPKVYGTTTQNVQANVAQETRDFEKTIKTMQNTLANQLDEQLFSQYRSEIKIKWPHPRINFVEHSEETKMFQARRLSQYSKYHMLTPDENLENDIRQLEGLSPRKKVKKSESCVYGLGECPVRKGTKVSFEQLAKFCASCPKKVRKDVTVEPEGEEELHGSV